MLGTTRLARPGLGAGIAQWLEHRTRDWKVAGSNPCWNGGRIFFSRVDFLCWLLFRYPFHPRVTAVARKKSRSFCQKCRWQVTAKHAYTLRIEPCFGIGHNLSLICQMTSEDIKHQLNNIDLVWRQNSFQLARTGLEAEWSFSAGMSHQDWPLELDRLEHLCRQTNILPPLPVLTSPGGWY